MEVLDELGDGIGGCARGFRFEYVVLREFSKEYDGPDAFLKNQLPSSRGAHQDETSIDVILSSDKKSLFSVCMALLIFKLGHMEVRGSRQLDATMHPAWFSIN